MLASSDSSICFGLESEQSRKGVFAITEDMQSSALLTGKRNKDLVEQVKQRCKSTPQYS